MYGAQTSKHLKQSHSLFENDVEMYGAQTGSLFCRLMPRFENDVEMYGAQTMFDRIRTKSIV